MKRIIFIFVFLLPCSLWGQSDVVKSDNVIERLYRSSVNEEVFIGTDFDYHSYNNVLLHEKHKRLRPRLYAMVGVGANGALLYLGYRCGWLQSPWYGGSLAVIDGLSIAY